MSATFNEDALQALTMFVANHEEAEKAGVDITQLILWMPPAQAREFLDKLRMGCEFWMQQFNVAVDAYVARLSKLPGAPQG